MDSTPDSKTIILNLVGKENRQKNIPITVVADYLRRVQHILYLICDQVEKNPFRSCGDFPGSVKDKCELVVTDLSIGSVCAALSLASPQTGLFPEFPQPGIQAINIFGKLVNASASEDEDVETHFTHEIPDVSRARKLMREFRELIPEEQSDITVSLGAGEREPVVLSPRYRDRFQKALQHSAEDPEIEILGRLVEISVDKKRRLRVDTPIGEKLISYSPDVEPDLLQNVGRIVRFKATTNMKKSNAIAHIDDDVTLVALERIPISELVIHGTTYVLDTPLEFEMEFEEEEYILTNCDLHLVVSCRRLKDCGRQVSEQMESLIDTYCSEPDEALTQDGREFRDRLKALIVR